MASDDKYEERNKHTLIVMGVLMLGVVIIVDQC